MLLTCVSRMQDEVRRGKRRNTLMLFTCVSKMQEWGEKRQKEKRAHAVDLYEVNAGMKWDEAKGETRSCCQPVWVKCRNEVRRSKKEKRAHAVDLYKVNAGMRWEEAKGETRSCCWPVWGKCRNEVRRGKRRRVCVLWHQCKQQRLKATFPHCDFWNPWNVNKLCFLVRFLVAGFMWVFGWVLVRFLVAGFIWNVNKLSVI